MREDGENGGAWQTLIKLDIYVVVFHIKCREKIKTNYSVVIVKTKVCGSLGPLLTAHNFTIIKVLKLFHKHNSVKYEKIF